MSDIKSFKQQTINNYISSLDFNDIANINVKKIEMDLHYLLGETPAVIMNYKTENILTEDGTIEKGMEFLESLTIYFSYDTKNAMGEDTILTTKETFLLQ